MKTFQAVYLHMPCATASGEAIEAIEAPRTFEAHAATWREAALQKLPRYLYPAGRRYRRVSGPFEKDTTS